MAQPVETNWYKYHIQHGIEPSLTVSNRIKRQPIKKLNGFQITIKRETNDPWQQIPLDYLDDNS